MTLFRQLFMGASVAFFLVLGAMEGVYVQNAHKYLQEQLSSHAQDAATSLGLVLPASLADNDLVRVEVTVNALFDRGYYQSIRVVNTKGETLVLKTLDAAPAGVPQWFVDLLPLETPTAESLISKGWSQMGRVVVSSHPNFAYKQLWSTLLEATLGLALLYLLALFALHGFLSRILRPLHEIETVAHAISKRDFQVVKAAVGARELRSVVAAINSMSRKLQAMIEYEVRQATRFRDESNKDVLTGLDNRRGFERQVHALLEGGADLSSGVLFLLQIDNFQRFNSSRGFHQGDALLKMAAEVLVGIWPGQNLLRARINGATYAVMAFNISRTDAARLGDEICAALAAATEARLGKSELSFGCGGVYFSGSKLSLNILMAECDMAMLQSQAGGNSVSVLTDFAYDEEEGRGSQFWRQLILDALRDERIALFAQPVMDVAGGGRLQIEVVGRLKNAEGELVPAGQFIPMANRHRLTAAIDLMILKRLFDWLSSGKAGDVEVAINLSIHSIHDAALLEWLGRAMRANPALSRRLVFEFTEFGLAQDRPAVELFVAEMRRLGAEFAVDNFGLHRTAFEYLQRMKPRYVKLSPSYIHGLHNNQESQFFISSVVKITHPLEVRVVALGVEDAAVLEVLRQLGVDGYQGYVSGEPEELRAS